MNSGIDAANTLGAWLALPYDFALERSVFGSTDATTIMRVVDEFCTDTFS
jgi:hypothetical protein